MMRFECEFQGATSDSTLIGYEFSGKRITRGTHRSATGIVVSADIQAAGNILRKVAVQLGISFVEAGKAALTLPKRYDLHLMRRVYRKNGDKGLVRMLRLQPISE